MILITPKNIFESKKVTDVVELKCENCHCIFTREKRAIQKVFKHILINGPKKIGGVFVIDPVLTNTYNHTLKRKVIIVQNLKDGLKPN